MHVVDTLILPVLFSVFLVALAYLGWRDLQEERRRARRHREEEGEAAPGGASSGAGPGGVNGDQGD